MCFLEKEVLLATGPYWSVTRCGLPKNRIVIYVLRLGFGKVREKRGRW